MSYTVSMLSTIAKCNAVLSMAGKEKGDMEFRKVALTRRKEEMSESGTEVDQDLTAINSEVAALQAIIAGLPAGPTKEAQITKLMKAELRQRALAKRDLSYGVSALLELELDLARAQKELDEINSFINEVNAKKATL